jgi:hypothetical protein
MNTPLLWALVPAGALLAGCCVRPASPWDRTALVEDREIPAGVVLVVDRRTSMPNMPVCAGTVFQQATTPAGGRAYVLTAKHCVPDDEPGRWGIAAPMPGARIPVTAAGLVGPRILDATRVAAAPSHFEFPLTLSWFQTATIDWVDDWAILTVDTPDPLPVLPLLAGDAASLTPGEPVVLVAYHDATFLDHDPATRRGTPFVELHEHPFSWTGVPEEIAQPGHSGAPIVRDGHVVAVLSGWQANSNGCRLLCGTWPVALQLVNVDTVRREAAQQGLRL